VRERILISSNDVEREIWRNAFRPSSENAAALMAEMQTIMTGKVAIFRTGRVLEEAVHELQQLLLRSRNIGLRTKGARRQSGTCDSLSGKEDAQALAVRRLRRLHPYRKQGSALPRGLPAPQRRRVAEPHLGEWKSENETLPSLSYEQST